MLEAKVTLGFGAGGDTDARFLWLTGWLSPSHLWDFVSPHPSALTFRFSTWGRWSVGFGLTQATFVLLNKSQGVNSATALPVSRSWGRLSLPCVQHTPWTRFSLAPSSCTLL